MSREGLTTVLGRAALDSQYLERLRQDPEAAVTEVKVDLLPEELEALKTLDFDALRQFNDLVNAKNIVAFFDKKDH